MRYFSALFLLLSFVAPAFAGVDFNEEVRPILSDRCFRCHGPDSKNQSSDFRVDSFEEATADLGGHAGIVPGNPDASELVARILSDDEDDIMPPPDSKMKLTQAEKETLKQWIAEGAKYEAHWAFQSVEKPALPVLPAKAKGWAKNGIDHFVAVRLAEEGLNPSPEAKPLHLRRRTALALTGLSPDTELKGTHEDQVEHHLASIHYAERQALEWLDAARFADTDGYQNDAERSNWPWRDWVIAAYRDNMPFDQFTIEQLAGDMLPEATTSQKLASAFNRNHRQNSEGGALAPEFFVENVIDRVETTSTVWLGLTMGCARCHDHKYDPVTQKEFFSMFAYFNNIGERGTGKGVSANPILRTRSPLGEVPAELLTAVEAAKAQQVEATKTLPDRARAWAKEQATAGTGEPEWAVVEVTPKVKGGGELVSQDDKALLFQGKPGYPTYELRFQTGAKPVTALRFEFRSHPSLTKPRQLAPSVNGNFVMTDLKVRAAEKEIAVSQVSASFEQANYPVKNLIDGNAKSGWAVDAKDFKGRSEQLHLVLAAPVQGEVVVTMKHGSGFVGHHPGLLQLAVTTQKNPTIKGVAPLPKNLTDAIAKDPATWNPKELKVVTDHFRKTDAPLLDAEKKLKAAEAAIVKAGYGEVPVMVMQESEKIRPAYLLNRGAYDDPDESEEIQRLVPAALFPEGKEAPTNRLELAQWIVSKDNPLTARVIVNRVWQQHFGVGLAKTAEDFGVQGEVPSHPELLDWLAATFMESGWDVKALHRLILNSATYRQSSAVTPEMTARDPENRLLSRGPRFRLDGFAIRDNALRSAGLLGDRVGGPPVKPYQPAGLWNAVSSGAGTRYPVDAGEKLYRKSIYTYWKRAVNPPRQIIFDASGREACNVRKKATNTPLQALVLMNDPTFLEAARHLAERALVLENANDEKRIQTMARTVLARDLVPEEIKVISENLRYFRTRFEADENAAADFLKHGASPRNEAFPLSEHAAITAAAHLLLNLDESITLQ